MLDYMGLDANVERAQNLQFKRSPNQLHRFASMQQLSCRRLVTPQIQSGNPSKRTKHKTSLETRLANPSEQSLLDCPSTEGASSENARYRCYPTSEVLFHVI
eukprot:TRINITY_DN6281_c0_g1_i1.p1 TRINITY_DN6281_c0_g1~~TRINITY_DN6281_c0_g1_i1.p1  ORF type:complete len:102 (-),score=4.79 TRINITY_DN6281_c0_g1_i1:155-460(-)